MSATFLLSQIYFVNKIQLEGDFTGQLNTNVVTSKLNCQQLASNVTRKHSNIICS